MPSVSNTNLTARKEPSSNVANSERPLGPSRFKQRTFCIGSVSGPCFVFFVTFITTRDSYLYVRLWICYLSHKIKYKLDDGREMHSLHVSPGGGK